MIKLTNVNKRYGERLILKNINLTLPSHGLVVIHGPSGCGKTTLLNCLAGLTAFQGSIEIDQQNIASMNESALSKWRLKSIGFIFQDFKLFETETAWRNLVFPLDTLLALPLNLRNHKCADVLAVVGLTHKKKEMVNKLSGGEKQRVAIARALINDPCVLLADEPTGALDQKNGAEIMRLIKNIAAKSLVVLVSHDQELAQQFADIIIEMNDGVATKSSIIESKTERQSLPIIKNKYLKRKIKIPLDFLISHTIHKIKQKKWRTCISYGMTSLGLIGIGLAFSLSSTIGTNIKQAYQELIDENSVMVKLKDNATSINGQYAANFYEVSAFAEEYSSYVQDVGVTYYCNFESFFPDSNALAVVKDLSYRVLPGVSARHINEFIWLEDLKTTIYPKPVSNLADDEIVLGLDMLALKDLCFELQIERTVLALTNYLVSNELNVYFDLENVSWTYSDQQILKVVAFTLENDITIYHSNHLWNEYMFEERMRFPTSDAVSQIDKNPWVMKKIYYLKTFEKRDELINLLIEDKVADEYIFEIADESYYPWLYYNRAMSERNRLLVFQNTIAHIPSWQIPYFLANDDNLLAPIKGNQNGYLIFPDTLMVGFAKTLYFAKDQILLEEIIDQQTTRDYSSTYQEELPPNVLSGNYATSLQGGVQYRLINEQKINGKVPQSNKEVVVSSAFSNQMNIDNLPVTIYVATSKSESLTEEGRLISDYVILPLTITGIINANKSLIYQFENWTTLFFQCEVGVSSFSLQTNVLSFPLKNSNKMKESLLAFQKDFPQYEAINPLNDINDSVDTVCNYLSLALIIFSSISTFIAIILLTMCNYLYALEGKKDIALARCLGVDKKESRKFLFVNSIFQCLVSFVLASFELVITSVIANIEISQTFSLGFNFVFNAYSLIPMLVLALMIAVVSSGLISSRINRINPIDALNS